MPTNINEVTQEFIEKYCVENNQIDWLLETVNKTIVDKKGQTRSYPFISTRRDFCLKFFPKLIKGTSKKESFKDRLNKKYGKK